MWLPFRNHKTSISRLKEKTSPDKGKHLEKQCAAEVVHSPAVHTALIWALNEFAALEQQEFHLDVCLYFPVKIWLFSITIL